jgi:hypothetical protein
MSKANEILLQRANDLTFIKYFTQFFNLTLNIFKWEDTGEVESRFIERTLIENGYCFVYQDNDYGLICMPCSLIGLNIYNEPTHIQITSPLISKTLEVDDGVLIYNNYTKTGLIPIIMNYVDRLTEIETTINTNIYLQKTPYIIVADKKTEKSIREVANQITNNEPVIVVKSSIVENLQNLELHTNFVAPELFELKQKIENEFLTFIGLNNNSQTNKKERLIVDEVNVNNDYINRNVDILYNAREIACKKINEKFGVNWKVTRQNNLSESLFKEVETDKEVEVNE